MSGYCQDCGNTQCLCTEIAVEEARRKAHSLHRLVRGRRVHVMTTPPRKLEDKHGYTKHGHGRHYINIGAGKYGNPGKRWVDKAWDRRCDASRWAKRAGAKEITHWYQI